ERIFEGDDAPDQVDARGVRLLRGPAQVEVRARRAVGACNRRGAALERDVAAFVLQVDLDGVQAGLLQREVVLELAGQAHQRPRDVDAANLLRGRPPER